MSILMRLEPDIHRIAWRCMTAGTGQLSYQDGWDDMRISMLERRDGRDGLDGLDSLAALILAARWAKANGHGCSTYKLCGAICRKLLVHGLWLYSRGIARPLVEFVQQTVLIGGTWCGERHDFWSQGYLEGVLSFPETHWYESRDMTDSAGGE